MTPTLLQLLREAVSAGASDLHISAFMPPMMRLDGRLLHMPGYSPLDLETTEKLCFEELKPEQIERFNTVWEFDFSFDLDTTARVRGNLYRHMESVGGAFRMIPFEVPSAEELGLPAIINTLTRKSNGLILVTGPTGSGKSTTLAAMINQINATRHDHIVTIEDPIEYVYRSKKCLITQREVEHDTHTFIDALKHVLRQDPDVVLIGEMRDLATIQSAITVAETGHLVLATLHTNSAVQTIDRIIDVFPPHQQPQIRMQLSMILQGILSQQLVPKVGGGRCLAMEIMTPNYAIRNLIRESKVHQIYSQMQIGQEGSSMQTLNQSLATLANSKLIAKEEALARSNDSEELANLLQ